ncbi:MAG: YjbQ family protein [Solirubrobacteraceae bacterium]
MVEASSVERGVATVFVTGSTAAVTTMEYEPGGVRDLTDALERLVPAEGDYAPRGLRSRPPTIVLDFDERQRDRTVTSRSCADRGAGTPQPGTAGPALHCRTGLARGWAGLP